MDQSTKNLMFLLAAAPLAIACGGDDEGTSGSGDSMGETASQGSEGSSTGEDEAGSGTAGTGAAGTDSTGSSSTDMGDSADASSSGGTVESGTAESDTTTDGAETEGPAYTPVCPPYAELVAECYGSQYLREALDDCQSDFGYYAQYGAECGGAFEDYIACLSELNCMGLETPLDCQDEMGDISDACTPP